MRCIKGIDTRNYIICVLILMIFIFIILRFYQLEADPSPLVSNDIITDEGWFSQNARNHYLFGEWVLDEHNPAYILCPVYTFIVDFFFRIFGNSIFTLRLISSLSFLGILILVGIRLRNNKNVLFLTLLLLSINPLLFSYYRTGFIEPLQSLGMTLVWFCATHTDKDKKYLFLLLSGLFGALTILIKPTVIITVLFLFPALIARNKRDNILKDFLYVALGFFVVFVSFLPFYIENKDLLFIELSREGQIISDNDGLGGIISPLSFGMEIDSDMHIYKPTLIYFLVILPVGLIFLLLQSSIKSIAYTNCEKTDEFKKIYNITLLWFVFKLISYFPQRIIHSSTRYWISIFIPVTILISISFLSSFKPGYKTRSLIFSFILWYLLRPLLGFLFSYFKFSSISFFFIVYLCFSLLTFIIIISIKPNMKTPTRVIGLCFLLIFLFWSSVIIYDFFNYQFTQKECIDDINSIIGDNAVVTGDIANTFSINSDRYAFVTRNLEDMRMGTGIINKNWDEKSVDYLIVTSSSVDFSNIWRPYGDFDMIKSYEIIDKSYFSHEKRFTVYLLNWIK